MRSIRVLLLSAALLPALLAGCLSSEQLREQADADVRSLVESRRARLALGDGSFTIATAPDSLRQRLLRGETAGTPPLDLVACLEIAAENSREYQRRKEDLYLTALDLTLERWRFGVQPDAVAAGAVDGVGEEATDAAGSARFSLQRLLGTGALLAGDIGLNLARVLTTGDGWSPVADLGGSITQPLLAGSSRAIVEEPLTQAERNLVYSVRTFERFRRTFSVDVATRFYRLLQTADSVVNQELNYNSLVDLSERNAELARAGRIPDIDVGQARQDELRSKNSLLEAQEDYSNQLDAFKLFLGLPIETAIEFAPGVLAELSQAGLAAIELDEQRALDHALANRLDYLNTVEQREDSERKVHVAADALRAGLTLGASARATSEEGEPFDFDFKETTWSLAAALDLPIDQLPGRNNYREALIAFDVATRNAELAADTIRADLREQLRSLESRRLSYDIQVNASGLAERRIESARLKLEAGRADTRSLLEAERALLDAQNSVTSALVEYTLTRLNLYRDLELLRVDENGISVDEQTFAHPPEQAPVPGGDGEPKP